jgi:hypothetical protein
MNVRRRVLLESTHHAFHRYKHLSILMELLVLSPACGGAPLADHECKTVCRVPKHRKVRVVVGQFSLIPYIRWKDLCGEL